MQALSYLFILALALGAACGGDSNKQEEKLKSDSVETAATYSTAETKAKQQSTQQARQEVDTLYRITGTEPFWSLILARPRSIYTSAEGDTLRFDFKEARQASARRDEYVQVFELGEGQQLVLRKMEDCPCSDGMSSQNYPYQATLILAEKVLDGCGRKPEAGN